MKINRTKHFFNLCLLCFSIILVACSNPELPDGHRYGFGSFTFVMSDDFEAKDLSGPTLESAKETFGYINTSAPSLIHIITKDDDNEFVLMYNNGYTGVDYGTNESFKKHTIKNQVSSLEEVLRGGEFKMMKFNGINVIKYSKTNVDGLYFAYYYLLDNTQVSFFVVTYPSSEPEWKKVEDAMFKSIKRAEPNEESFAISKKDSKLMHHIMDFCVNAKDTVSIDMHRDFWETVDKNGGVAKYLDVYGLNLSVEELMAELGISYWEAYYEDALIAYRTGGYFESDKRKFLGTYLDSEVFEYSNYEIYKIANREPILEDDEEVVRDEEQIVQLKKERENKNNTIRYNLNVLYDRDSFRNS